jgi:hypothetical protein
MESPFKDTICCTRKIGHAGRKVSETKEERLLVNPKFALGRRML